MLPSLYNAVKILLKFQPNDESRSVAAALVPLLSTTTRALAVIGDYEVFTRRIYGGADTFSMSSSPCTFWTCPPLSVMSVRSPTDDVSAVCSGLIAEPPCSRSGALQRGYKVYWLCIDPSCLQIVQELQQTLFGRVMLAVICEAVEARDQGLQAKFEVLCRLLQIMTLLRKQFRGE